MKKLVALVDLVLFKVLDKMVFPKRWLEFPPEYNREIHGPYNPSVYYGKRDTPFSEVKLGELPAWFGRRNKTPSALAQLIGRAWYRHQLNWIQVKYPSGAGIYQTFAVVIIFFYFLDYGRYKQERAYRYH